MNAFRTDVIEQLRQQMARVEEISPREEERISTGIAALDAILPQHGWQPGDLVEWLREGSGSGAATLALASAAPFLARGGILVVIDAAGAFYPPVLTALGISLQSTVIVRPQKSADTLWAIEQTLRCPGVAITFALCADNAMAAEKSKRPAEPLTARHALRRLQLAAETGGGLGVLLRPASVRSQPTWAQLRLLVRALPSSTAQATHRHLQVEVLYARGSKSGGAAHVELCDDHGCLRVLSHAAEPAAARKFAPSRRPEDAAGGEKGTRNASA